MTVPTPPARVRPPDGHLLVPPALEGRRGAPGDGHDGGRAHRRGRRERAAVTSAATCRHPTVVMMFQWVDFLHGLPTSTTTVQDAPSARRADTHDRARNRRRRARARWRTTSSRSTASTSPRSTSAHAASGAGAFVNAISHAFLNMPSSTSAATRRARCRRDRGRRRRTTPAPARRVFVTLGGRKDVSSSAPTRAARTMYSTQAAAASSTSPTRTSSAARSATCACTRRTTTRSSVGRRGDLAAGHGPVRPLVHRFAGRRRVLAHPLRLQGHADRVVHDERRRVHTASATASRSTRCRSGTSSTSSRRATRTRRVATGTCTRTTSRRVLHPDPRGRRPTTRSTLARSDDQRAARHPWIKVRWAKAENYAGYLLHHCHVFNHETAGLKQLVAVVNCSDDRIYNLVAYADSSADVGVGSDADGGQWRRRRRGGRRFSRRKSATRLELIRRLPPR